MSSFLNSLEDELRVMEEEIKALREALDSIVARLDSDKLIKLAFRLEHDCDKLYDKQFRAQLWESDMLGSSMLVFPFILFPDGSNGPLYRRITSEDVARWREAYKLEVRVVLGKESVEVIAPSKVAKEYKTTGTQTILAAQQQGYTVLSWDEYQNLLDEIDKLIGGDEQQDRAIEPPCDTARIVIGIPLTASDSTQEVKILPKGSPA